jgi:hypothetical protein
MLYRSISLLLAFAALKSSAQTDGSLTIPEDNINNPPPAPNNDPAAVINSGDFGTCFGDCIDSLDHCCILSDKACDSFANSLLGRGTTLPDHSDADGDLACDTFYAEGNRTLYGNGDKNATIYEDMCAEYCFSDQFMLVNNSTQVVSRTLPGCMRAWALMTVVGDG